MKFEFAYSKTKMQNFFWMRDFIKIKIKHHAQLSTENQLIAAYSYSINQHTQNV